MRFFRIVVVTGSVQISGHDCYELGAVLSVVGFAHLNARDFGDAVVLVGRFQGGGQEVFPFHGVG